MPEDHNTLRNLYIFSVLIIIIFICLAFLSSGKNKSKTVVSFKVVNAEYHNKYASSITTSDEKRLYLYYEEFGIVNVYAVDGDFLYQLRFGHLPTGKGAIAVIDGLLYVKSRGSIIYVVKEKELIEAVVSSYDDWLNGDRKYQYYQAMMEKATQ